MSDIKILIAGFGGQGVLFVGKYLAYNGLLKEKHLSWLPSYGPEMRGGTANCSVILSDTPVGSPIVAYPDCLVAMNLPSLDKYEDSVVSGGKIFVDSTLIERKVRRTDVTTYYVPATALARKNGMPSMANMILLGKIMKECPEVGEELIEETLKKVMPPKKLSMIDTNLNALKIGREYTE